MKKIEMVNLRGQYDKMSKEIDAALLNAIRSGKFINGPNVISFERSLQNYLSVEHVITCANGTDALQIALMALELRPGDEVIIPAFTYIATAEVIALLGLKPVMADVDYETFNLTASCIKPHITNKTKAVVPVHLYGQSCDMESILKLAKEYDLFVIEDNAQSIGATYKFSNGLEMKTGTIGDIGTTSFFPSKNLGCYGDGGAVMTRNPILAEKIKMIANHGQIKKYHHEIVGVNSRLDTIQAAILEVKLKYLTEYIRSRNTIAECYDEAFRGVQELDVPKRTTNSDHVFHQYTLKVGSGQRDNLKAYLEEAGIPSMVYYPLPVYQQNAFSKYVPSDFSLQVTEELCEVVLSLPIDTEVDLDQVSFICDTVIGFFKSK